MIEFDPCMHYPLLPRTTKLTHPWRNHEPSGGPSSFRDTKSKQLNYLHLPSLSRAFMMIYQHLQPKTCQTAWQLQLASTRSKLDSIELHSEACHLPLYLNQPAKFQESWCLSSPNLCFLKASYPYILTSRLFGG